MTDDVVKKSAARRARFGVVGAVESHSKKFFRSAPTQITSITTAVSSHTRGVSRSSRTRDEMRWTRQRWASEAQGGLLSVSGWRHARRRRSLRTVKSCGPDASTLASSLAEARSAQPGRTKPSIRKATVAKEPDRRGEYEVNR